MLLGIEREQEEQHFEKLFVRIRPSSVSSADDIAVANSSSSSLTKVLPFADRLWGPSEEADFCIARENIFFRKKIFFIQCD